MLSHKRLQWDLIVHTCIADALHISHCWLCLLQADSQDVGSSAQDVVAKSLELAVKYNAQLAEQRRTTRHTYVDTQTKVQHFVGHLEKIQHLSAEVE